MFLFPLIGRLAGEHTEMSVVLKLGRLGRKNESVSQREELKQSVESPE